MNITIDQIKELRSITGAGLADVKEALNISKGDIEEAKKYIAKKGLAKAEKRADREAKQGMIASYIHNTYRVATLVEINCETDFVARSDDFMEFGKNVAMQVAALNPQYISKEEIPSSITDGFIDEVNKDANLSSKPQEVKDKIIESKLASYSEENCLLEQKFFKDESVRVRDLLNTISGKVGESVKIRKFIRYEVGA